MCQFEDDITEIVAETTVRRDGKVMASKSSTRASAEDKGAPLKSQTMVEKYAQKNLKPRQG